MEKITKGTPLSQSTDIIAQNIETLKQLFPTIVTEGKINFKELEALLSDDIETDTEFYSFQWQGKSEARKEANKPSTATLRPDKASSKDWDTTENIFIEGDNLEVLKLLQKSYANKIKMIYIDPPYNTGKDFVYEDDYADNLNNYFKKTGQTDDEGKRLSTNTETDGRYHSNWLNMIYPRLKLARNLLTDDGVIFISIDDNEVANLKKVCDEIFGEENLISQFIWFYEGVNDNQEEVKKTHEYILLYSKNRNLFTSNKTVKDVNVNLGEIIDNSIVKNGFANPVSKVTLPKGFPCELESGVIPASEIKSLKYLSDIEIENFKLKRSIDVESGWSSKDILTSYIESEFTPVLDSKAQKTTFVIKASGNIHYLKQRDQSYIISVLRNYGTTQSASNYLESMGMKKYFSFPKPVKLISFLINIQSIYKDEIILDFFAGSGTTAHSVMQLNAEDGGNRKCISVQLPEPTAETSEAFKAGYKVISKITKERIRRAGEKIKEMLPEGQSLDIGFRAFTLDSSNLYTWDGNPDTFMADPEVYVRSIKADRNAEDVLFEILLKYGLDLTIPMEQRQFAGKTVYNVGMGSLFICLDNNITTEVAQGIGTWKEAIQPATTRVIFNDNGFTDVEKTNSMQILKRFGISEVNTI